MKLYFPTDVQTGLWPDMHITAMKDIFHSVITLSVYYAQDIKGKAWNARLPLISFQANKEK